MEFRLGTRSRRSAALDSSVALAGLWFAEQARRRDGPVQQRLSSLAAATGHSQADLPQPRDLLAAAVTPRSPALVLAATAAPLPCLSPPARGLQWPWPGPPVALLAALRVGSAAGGLA